MSARHRGGEVVGRVDDLAPVEAGAVLFLRMWGRNDRAQEARDLRLMREVDAGSRALETLERICALCAQHGRRPLMRHSLGCNCLGADENFFAQMIGAAADGVREDAMMLATLIVRPDFAPALAALSEEFGLALKTMSGPVTTGERVLH
ncbi:hypothetical protein Q5Y75_19075 [Ruegeria sp. 2205SS24-7]|uniref:hypothetical protein n=1 Tax=Ruegeria discodermiae TaxID=3064389 RepID=UPI00274256F3|nr:hypothetical protein [Ruegeria sp. 2205SS24-7]MDP5219326.1 hypothetical protein [Ruegeria sp. 2205SS24-7]